MLGLPYEVKVDAPDASVLMQRRDEGISDGMLRSLTRGRPKGQSRRDR
jgi:hypothetical protein